MSGMSWNACEEVVKWYPPSSRSKQKLSQFFKRNTHLEKGFHNFHPVNALFIRESPPPLRKYFVVVFLYGLQYCSFTCFFLFLRGLVLPNLCFSELIWYHPSPTASSSSFIQGTLRRLLSDWSVQSGISLANPLKSCQFIQIAGRQLPALWPIDGCFLLFQASCRLFNTSVFRTPCHFINIQFFLPIQFFNEFSFIDLKQSPYHKLLIDTLARNYLDNKKLFCLVRKVISSCIISKTFWVTIQNNAVK